MLGTGRNAATQHENLRIERACSVGELKAQSARHGIDSGTRGFIARDESFKHAAGIGRAGKLDRLATTLLALQAIAVDDARGRSILLQAAITTAAALTCLGRVDDHVAQLARSAVGARKNLAVTHDARTDTGAERHEHKAAIACARTLP